MLTGFYLQQVTNVLSVDISAKFQRPFMKPNIFTARRLRKNNQMLSGFVVCSSFSVCIM